MVDVVRAMGAPERGSTRRGVTVPRRLVGSTALLGVVAALPLVLSGPILTYDGPQHVLAGYLLNHLTGDPSWVRNLELMVPVTAWFVPLTFATLERVLPWWVAEHVVLALIVWLQSTGAIRLARLGGSRRWWLALPIAWAWPWMSVFYYGFLNYAAALGLAAHAVASFEGARAGGARWGAALGLVVLTTLSHSFAALLVVGPLSLCALADAASARSWRRAVTLGAVLAPAVIGALATAAVTGGDGVSIAALAAHAAPWERLMTNGFDGPFGPDPWGGIVFISALAVAAASGTRDPAAWIPLGGAALYTVTSAFAPEHLQGWETVGCRFAPAACLCAAWAIGAARVSRPTSRVAVAAVVLGLGVPFVAFGVATVTNTRALAALRRDALAAIEPDRTMPGAGRRHFVRPNHRFETVPPAHMAANVHAYYMIEEGGTFDLLFAGLRSAHFVRWRDDRPYRFRTAPLPRVTDDPASSLDRLLVGALSADEVLLWMTAPAVIASLERAGFTIVGESGRMTRMDPPNRAAQITGVEPGARAAALGGETGVVLADAAATPCTHGSCVILRDLPASPVRVIVYEGADRRVVAHHAIPAGHDAVTVGAVPVASP